MRQEAGGPSQGSTGECRRHTAKLGTLRVLGADAPLLTTLCRAKASVILIILGKHLGAVA